MAAQPGEEDQQRRRSQAQPHDGPVPAQPHLLGQEATLGEQAGRPGPQLEHHIRDIGSFRYFLESPNFQCPQRGAPGQRRPRPANGFSSQILLGIDGMPRRVG